MKNIYLWSVVALTVSSLSTLAQDKNVGIGTTTPDQSAVLDIQSSNKGLLIPRMTLDQRNDITKPVDGLLIYQTNDKSGFYFYEKNRWKPISSNEAKSVAAANADNWSKTGDAGTDPANNFIGTSDNQPLVFKTNSVESMRVLENGNLSLSKDLVFDSPSVVKGLNYKRNGVNRWIQQLDGAETGGDEGSDFTLYRYNDAGIYAGTALNINRKTGLTTFGGNTKFQGNFEIDGTVTNRFFTYTKNGLNRFAFQLDGAETGGNSGSDFYFYRYNDAGIYQGAILKFNRNSGESTFGGSVKVQTVTGHLAIGDFAGVGLTTPVGYRLIVQDGILTEKVKVALKTSSTDWADYVFEPDYKLMSLEEVENFTKENKHLPNVPSADEMVESGLDVAQTSKMFMEKIEELTLYMIELNKEVKALKAENEVLKAKLK